MSKRANSSVWQRNRNAEGESAKPQQLMSGLTKEDAKDRAKSLNRFGESRKEYWAEDIAGDRIPLED